MTAWIEPESVANTANPPTYPYNNATATASGHSFEMDDSPDRERIRIQHRDGSFVEFHPKGNVVNKILGNGFEIILKDKNVSISGDCNITINGNANIQVDGNAFTKIKGNADQVVSGNLTQVCEGDTSITSAVGKSVIITADNIDLNAVTSVNVNANLNVRGDILCRQSITAFGNLNAGINVFATESLQTTGYLSVLGVGGIGGLLTAGAAITATGIVTASDFVSSITTFNTHTHTSASPGSPTSAPIT